MDAAQSKKIFSIVAKQINAKIYLSEFKYLN